MIATDYSVKISFLACHSGKDLEAVIKKGVTVVSLGDYRKTLCTLTDLIIGYSCKGIKRLSLAVVGDIA